MKMFNAKKNQKFESKVSGNVIRVRDVKSDRYDNRYSRVTVVNLDERNRAVKDSERKIYMDSIRRRYYETV